MNHYLFTAIDTWFFKESRSMDSSGTNILESLFPPTNKTIMGALRRQIGEQYHEKHGSTWSEFKAHHNLTNTIGFGDSHYANLKAQGAWLYQSELDQLFFPVPYNLLKQEQKGLAKYDFFNIGDAIETDLGKVKFAELNYKKKQSSIENHYVSCEIFTQILTGKLDRVNDNEIVELAEILKAEARTGIARETKTRNVVKGKLYQTKHIRIQNNWHVYFGLMGIDESYKPIDTMLRLGGEARMASLSQLVNINLPKAPKVSGKCDYLTLYLLSDLPDYRYSNKLPPLPNTTFKKVENNGETNWIGKIENKEVTIETAIIGKLNRIGGWDLANHCPQAVTSFIPAGSCWYIKLQDNQDGQSLIDVLHLKYLTVGNDRALGYGQIAIGNSPKNTLTENK